MRIALATCRTLPEPDHDQDLLLAALRERGCDAQLVAWDDPSAEDLGGFDRCIIRSTWNYHQTPDQFLAWVDHAARATTLHNPAEVIRWNLHKSYLRELESHGVAIVPTLWVNRGEMLNLAVALTGRRWHDVIIKPAVSAASNNTRRFTITELPEAQAFLETLAVTRDMMIQPYLRSVEQQGNAIGERCLIHINRRPSHVVFKSRRLSSDHERITKPRDLTAKETAFAARVLDSIPHPLLYARVDVMTADDGSTLLSELELIEPSLFLVHHPPAVDCFVKAILASA